MRRNVWLLAIVLIAVLLGANNTVYYFTTKQSLEENLRHELQSIAKQIEISIELSRQGSEKFQEQIGRELRAVSIAAQYALDPDVEKVTKEQLTELSMKLDVLHITLLKRTIDNIVLYKSSDPKQIGFKTNTWDPWYQAFNELFDTHNVTIDWGQSLENFWTGPFEFAQTETSKIRKWGYYYDGSTNYIIDPYISYEDRQMEYDKQTGVGMIIAKTLLENSQLLEITGINPSTFPLGEQTTVTQRGDKLAHMTQQPIVYGSYLYKHADDQKLVQKAIQSNQSITVNTTINNKHVLKLYIPVSVDKSTSMLDENGEPINRYVLTLVADYKTIQNSLDKQFSNIALIMLVVTVLSLVIVYLIASSYRRAQDKLVRRTQETYVEEINGLFRAIREQRHDFMNHVQTIHALAELNKTDELKSYTSELTGEIRQLNDIINIGNPAIAALIRSKISQAESLKIKLETSFADMSNLALGIKSLDLTRVLGNLIDNAFDEVMNYPEERRLISIKGSQTNGYMEFEVSNTCDDAGKLDGKPLFESGYSMKGATHSGLGLSIVKSIVDKYKGSVRIVLNEPNKVTFIIRISD
ncbi:sensor histidine kinase [Paenibacillus spongiae]|uniref:GHKL domain-containing protein n=1 Tax=Paenibacillus spongiae TaxID=2909671 RepID=A0ABY5S7A3_9BACL|nr:GHKL domain-containing protein [Paenibacillus spongiae]UVI28593.1 GHKL domain-containing protein [Paenibacillus spongiae]